MGTLMFMDIMSLKSLHLPLPHLPPLTSLPLLLVLEATPVVPLLILTRSPQGLRGKRSAEDEEAVAEEPAAAAAHVAVAHPYYGGYYGHQLGWASFRAPGFESTLWGGRLGKRSADAEPGYGYYGYPAYRGYYGYPYGYGLGVAGHPTGTSYSHRSPQGLGK